MFMFPYFMCRTNCCTQEPCISEWFLDEKHDPCPFRCKPAGCESAAPRQHRQLQVVVLVRAGVYAGLYLFDA